MSYEGKIKNQVIVDSLGDLPTPVNGVITLEDDTNYIITTKLNIGNNRLVSGIKTAILGYGPESCEIGNTLSSADITVEFLSVIAVASV